MPDLGAQVLSEQLVAAARTRAEQLGPPTSRAEAWRYVATKALATPELDAADPEGAIDRARDILGPLLDGALVVIDGRCADGAAPPSGVELRHEATSDELAIWEQRLSAVDAAEAWTWADCRGMLGVRLTGVQRAPLRIVHLVTGGQIGWRLALHAAPGAIADCELITCHLGRARYAAGVDVASDRDSVLRVAEWETGADRERIGIAAHHKHFELAANAHLSWHSGFVGGVCQRHATRAILAGERAEVALGGSTVVGDGRQAHHLVRLEHRVGNAVSRQVFKAVARERGTSSFDGLIRVDHGADGTDAFQQANGLEIGDRARVAARPQLDVFTDDVSASHGATVGRPDPDEIRYLRSRGLDEQAATALIVDGFVAEGLAAMLPGNLRERILAELIAELRA